MAKFGKISTIKREPNSRIQSMDNSLLSKGMTRIPGTGVYKYPYKEIDNKYRTGLDPNAVYISRIQDPTEKQLEIERVTKLKVKLEEALRVDLSPNSSFWNSKLLQGENDTTHVKPAKLMDGDNLFDFSNPWMELTFAWLRVHPTIASSYQAWERGEYPADTQWYVVDEEIETKINFNKKQLINKAILIFEQMTPSKRKKVARQLDLPVTEDTTEEQVYNLIDNVLKQSEFKSGKHKSLSPVKIFLQYSQMADNLLNTKDLVKSAITHSIYRLKQGGKVFEGEYKVADSEDDLVKHLMDDDNQEDLIALEQKLKTKKFAIA